MPYGGSAGPVGSCSCRGWGLVAKKCCFPVDDNSFFYPFSQDKEHNFAGGFCVPSLTHTQIGRTIFQWDESPQEYVTLGRVKSLRPRQGVLFLCRLPKKQLPCCVFQVVES